MNDLKPQLSPHASRRREVILVLAEQALEGRVRRRRARRAAATAFGLGIVAVALLARGSGESDHVSPRHNLVVTPSDPPRASPRVEPHMLSDAELVQELAAVGIKAGVVRFGSTIRLVADDGTEIIPPVRPRSGAAS
ncbi:MAG: hypothetical protein SGJ09_04925 [Phycisphaerae bacterium]|nr:hypothetical protein [Phycisphaerae bacterium]